MWTGSCKSSRQCRAQRWFHEIVTFDYNGVARTVTVANYLISNIFLTLFVCWLLLLTMSDEALTTILSYFFGVYQLFHLIFINNCHQ